MQTSLDINKATRNNIIKILDNHSLEALNKIPPGFKNNLIWNIAHVIAIQQFFSYKLSGLDMLIPEEFLQKYTMNTFPDGKTTQAEKDEIKRLLVYTVDQTQKDFDSGKFTNYNPFVSKTTGFSINSLKEGLAFNNYHEAVHTGVMMSIMKFL
jgi:hypothetical protein